MDMNGHINNVAYLGWALDATPEYVFDSFRLKEVVILTDWPEFKQNTKSYWYIICNRYTKCIECILSKDIIVCLTDMQGLMSNNDFENLCI